MTRDAIRKELMMLSPEDRLELAEELLSSIPTTTPPLSEEDERLLEERIAAHERDPSAVCSADSVIEAIDQMLATKRRT